MNGVLTEIFPSTLVREYQEFNLPSEKDVRKNFSQVLKQIKDCVCDHCYYVKHGCIGGTYFKTCGRHLTSRFLLPVTLSPQMRDFLINECKVGDSTSFNRVVVTKHICNYIKDHHLYDVSDKRIILPNTALNNLLFQHHPQTHHPLNYFNLQVYLKQHYISCHTRSCNFMPDSVNKVIPMYQSEDENYSESENERETD